MNGPDHFVAGDRAMEGARQYPIGSDLARGLHAQAQAHYTAALVAATIYAIPGLADSWSGALE